jgi:transposase
MKGRLVMIVIGADIHKSTHALAAVSGDGGVVAGEREIRADEGGHRVALRWARKLDGQRVWAIEDCRHLSRRFEQALIAAGERPIRLNVNCARWSSPIGHRCWPSRAWAS